MKKQKRWKIEGGECTCYVFSLFITQYLRHGYLHRSIYKMDKLRHNQNTVYLRQSITVNDGQF